MGRIGRLLVLACTGAMALQACGRDAMEPERELADFEGYIRFDYEGDIEGTFESIADLHTAIAPVATERDDRLVISAQRRSATTQDILFLAIDTPGRAGTYLLKGSHFGHDLGTPRDSSTGGGELFALTGTLRLNAVTDRRIRGTFSGTGRRSGIVEGDSIVRPQLDIEIVDGAFDLHFERGGPAPR